MFSERYFNRRKKRNTWTEKPTPELFWGNPNGQFFEKGSGNVSARTAADQRDAGGRPDVRAFASVLEALGEGPAGAGRG